MTDFARGASTTSRASSPPHVRRPFCRVRRRLPSPDRSDALGQVLVTCARTTQPHPNRRLTARPVRPRGSPARADGAHAYPDLARPQWYRVLTAHPRLRCRECAQRLISPGSAPHRGEPGRGNLRSLASPAGMIIDGPQLGGHMDDVSRLFSGSRGAQWPLHPSNAPSSCHLCTRHATTFRRPSRSVTLPTRANPVSLSVYASARARPG